MSIDGQLSESRSDTTSKGYFLVVRTFPTGVWFEAYSTVVMFNQKQESLLSRLCFSVGTLQEIHAALRGWGGTYGQEFVIVALMAFEKYVAGLTAFSIPGIDDLLPPVPRDAN